MAPVQPSAEPAPVPAAEPAAPKVAARFEARPERVYAVLVDATGYPRWLVGAQRIRSVDGDWPSPGSGFEHTVGLGPLRMRGRTSVLSIEPPWAVTLEAGLGWMGSFVVGFELRDEGSSTVLEIAERPHSGLLRYAWRLGAAPLMRRLLWGRNHLSMQHLGDELDAEAHPVPADRDRAR